MGKMREDAAKISSQHILKDLDYAKEFRFYFSNNEGILKVFEQKSDINEGSQNGSQRTRCYLLMFFVWLR